ncbi:MAG: hypothetical protein AB7F35_25435 [Acetobacteraceae bacterium]|uniref:hypothetical protein n=1 Tax=Bradyrhizobium sp. TaxID=376 RepID=UPI003D149000
MALDPSKRGRLPLPAPSSRSLVSSKLDLAKIDAAIAQGRAVAAEEIKPRPAAPVSAPAPAPPPPAPAPRVERVRIQAHCCATGKSNVILAERRDNALRFIGNEQPGAGRGGGALPAFLSGTYAIDLNGWACPHCNAASMWICHCGKFDGVAHCDGNRNGLYRCACGRVEERSFVESDSFELRGQSMGTGTSGAAPGRNLLLSSRKGR